MKNEFRTLEQALQLWEDVSIFLRLGYRIEEGHKGHSRIDMTGPVVHARELRDVLLNTSAGKCLNKEQIEEFQRKFSASEKQKTYYGPISLLPNFLMDWNLSSRRVFHVANDLQLLLEATDLDEVVLNEVRFPFEAFAVRLGRPIEIEGGIKFDAFLCRILRDEGGIHTLLFDSRLNSYARYSREDTQRCSKAIEKKEWVHANKLHRKLEGNILRPRLEFRYTGILGLNAKKRTFKEQMLSVPIVTDDGVMDGVSYDEAAGDYKGRLMRILIGLSLYISTLPPGNPQASAWEPVPHRGSPDPRAMTSASRICLVTSSHTLTSEERNALEHSSSGIGGYELSAHFRRGHWRRPPGQGDDPLAPRIIWVRPTLVRRDRLHTGMQPGGSEAKVTT
ncbi:MAG: hypothetical protein WC551_00450 [Patescibacteria group bacterium]